MTTNTVGSMAAARETLYRDKLRAEEVDHLYNVSEITVCYLGDGAMVMWHCAARGWRREFFLDDKLVKVETFA